MNNTIQENEVLFDNEMLSRLDLIDYDIERTFYRVCMFMKKYRKLKVKNYCEVPIKITSTYKYVFVDEKTKGINDYTKLDAFIDNDTEYQELSKKICSITKNFSQEELVYYTICCIDKNLKLVPLRKLVVLIKVLYQLKIVVL